MKILLCALRRRDLVLVGKRSRTSSNRVDCSSVSLSYSESDEHCCELCALCTFTISDLASCCELQLLLSDVVISTCDDSR